MVFQDPFASINPVHKVRYPLERAVRLHQAGLRRDGVATELNASPYRLDMDWRFWRRAAGRGLECAINPDAHDTAGLDHVRAGVNSARKGWLTRENVVNTLPLAKVLSWLERKRGRK